MPEKEWISVVVTLWAIWYARRRIIHDGEYQSPMSTHIFIERFILDLDLVAQTKPAVGRTPARTLPHWLPPPVGSVKLNVDAAVKRDGSAGSVGVVCRSTAGLFLGASTITFKDLSDPAILEALACREALALALDLGQSHLCVASDCLGVINNLSRPFLGTYSTVLREIKWRTGDFDMVTFIHESRSANMEAHSLARFSSSLEPGRRVWFMQPPEGLCIPLFITG